MPSLRRLPLVAFALLLLALAPATSACDSDPDLASHEGILGLIPDDPDRRAAVFTVDYAALRRLSTPTEAIGSIDDTLSPLSRLNLAAQEYAGLDSLTPLGSRGVDAFPEIVRNWETGLGLSIDDFDLDVRAGGDAALAAAVGRFDADAIDAHLRDCAECMQPQRPTRDGTTYYDFGDGASGVRRLEPPVYDNLGRGGQYLFTDRYILHAFDSTLFEPAFDARGTDASLEGNPTFVELARTLDHIEAPEDVELLASIMSDLHQGPDLYGPAIEELSAERRAVVDEALAIQLLRPYTALAVAVGLRDDEQQITVVVLTHETPEAATENQARLLERLDSTRSWDGRPWTDLFSSWDVEVDDSTLVATFEGSPRWEIAGVYGDPLLLHE
jgi:hypothetical protein